MSEHNYQTYKIPPFELLETVSAEEITQESYVAKATAEELFDYLKRYFGVTDMIDDKVDQYGNIMMEVSGRPLSKKDINQIVGAMKMKYKAFATECYLTSASSIKIFFRCTERKYKLKEAKENGQVPGNLPIGVDVCGNIAAINLEENFGNILIGGAISFGGSNVAHLLICDLLMRYNPEEVKLLIVDTSKSEYVQYTGLPHLIGPTTDGFIDAVGLKIIYQIVNERYKLLAKNGFRSINAYNVYAKESGVVKPLPYTYVIIDKIEAMVMISRDEFFIIVQNIAMNGPSVGVGLIVVANNLKNYQRVSDLFSIKIVTTINPDDSYSNIGWSVKEIPHNRGDYYFWKLGMLEPSKIRAFHITDEEQERIAHYCKCQCKPIYHDEFIRLEKPETVVQDISKDPLFPEIKEYVIDVQKVSTSLLQRRFGIGYNRAVYMIDMLEEKGIIGPQQGSKTREVYIKRPDVKNNK